MNSLNNGIPVGTIINGCKILSEVGSGGMGIVYKAIDVNLNRFVAIKIMHSTQHDELAKSRMSREASAIASLDHPSIIRVFSYGEFENRPFFVMEFIEGCSVKDFINRCRSLHFSGLKPEELLDSGYVREHIEGKPYFHGDPLLNPLSNPQYPFLVRKLMISTASALGTAHENGIVHRDIKSSNILIDNDTRVKLIDFGIVKKRGNTDITRTDQFLGTLSYSAPEQLMGSRGEISARTDVYSFGIVLYELLTLKHPLQEEDPAAIVTFITQIKPDLPRTINPHITAEFEEIVMKCLEKDPAKRFRNGKEVERALKNYQQTSTWFSNFKKILKGWFVRESKKSAKYTALTKDAHKNISETQNKNSEDSSENTKIVAKKFLKKARKEFYISFAIIEAIENLKQAYELDPASSDILFMLSFTLNSIGNSIEIKKYLDASKKLMQNSPDKNRKKYLLIRDLFSTRDYEMGMKRASRLKEIYPDDLDFQFALFFSYEATGNYSAAIQEGNNLVNKLDDNNIIAVALSECYFSIMDFENAERILNDRYSDFTNLHLKSIQNLHIRGNFAKAENKVVEILHKDPQNMLMLFIHAKILACSEKFKESFSASRKAASVMGGASLRAQCFYFLYRLSELMQKPEVAKKYLEHAKKLKGPASYLSNEEASEIINTESLSGIEEEIENRFWKDIAIEFARKISFDSVDIRSYTIGNFGHTSVLEIENDGKINWHVIFSNFNLFESEEIITQLWIPEMPLSPFIDQSGNILPYNFYKIDGPIPGGIASIKLAEPWRPNQSCHIYCKFNLPKFDIGSKTQEIKYPGIPISACRKHALIVIGSENYKFEYELIPNKIETVNNREVLTYIRYITGGKQINPGLKVTKI